MYFFFGKLNEQLSYELFRYEHVYMCLQFHPTYIVTAGQFMIKNKNNSLEEPVLNGLPKYLKCVCVCAMPAVYIWCNG